MPSKKSAALAVALAAWLTAACGPTPADRPTADTGVAAGYPVTISNCGRDYTFSRPPSRVVVMNGASVAAVSALLALGLGDRIVANAQFYGASDVAGRAEAIANLPTGGIQLNDQFDIPREAMLGLRPDFVLSTAGAGFEAASGFATRQELAEAGANTYVPRATCGGANSVDGTQTIEDSYAVLRDLGRIFGVGDRADALIADSQRRIVEVGARVADRPAPRLLLLIPGMDMGTNAFSSVGANGIWNDIFAKSGAVKAFGDTTRDLFANLSSEQLAAAEVDAVVIVNWRNPDPDGDARRLLAQFPQWEAAKHNRYLVLSDSVYLGPDNVIAVERLARPIHPERF